MHESVKLMLDALTLIPTPDGAGAAKAQLSADRFTAPSLLMPRGRVYGGQVMAQALLAACNTVEADRPIHSLHGYFLRPGDDKQSIDFAIDRIHDGRSFSTRRTQAYQNDVPIFSMISSHQDRNGGLEHHAPMPANIPSPYELPSAIEVLSALDHPMAEYWAHFRPFDIRHVEGGIYDMVRGDRVAHQAVWMRTHTDLPDDPNVHRAAIAWASDYTILEPIFRRHGVAWADPELKAASLDHAMWFHRDARADEWMLYVLESPSAQGGRGLGLGRIYSQDGTLLVSVAQEGMIRASPQNL
jgi:acyl-CoA thioesterase-2